LIVGSLRSLLVGLVGDFIIANDNRGVGEQIIVEIASTDAGFASDGCGTLALVSDRHRSI
jgi:hypothetical protein